jgi:hypothetical protein
MSKRQKPDAAGASRALLIWWCVVVSFTEATVVRQLNEMWNGLRWSGLAVQLGGLLWVVVAWAAPGRTSKT